MCLWQQRFFGLDGPLKFGSRGDFREYGEEFDGKGRQGSAGPDGEEGDKGGFEDRWGKTARSDTNFRSRIHHGGNYFDEVDVNEKKESGCDDSDDDMDCCCGGGWYGWWTGSALSVVARVMEGVARPE